jgi:uncharacterized protein (TIGR03435 family)
MNLTQVSACASAALLTISIAFSQSNGKRPEFEVVSIKPAPPQKGPGMRIMMGGDPGRVNQSNISIRDMIRQAYQVKDYQISGPDWLNSERFDVVATIPPNTPKEDVPLMWQSLLADRFKLVLHRDKKDLPIYALVVAKGGPKLKPSENQDAPAGGPKGPPGMFGGARGTVMMGRGRMTANRTSISSFAENLSRQMDRPVIDETQLTGLYDITLEYTPDERQRMQFMPGMPAPPPGAGGPGGEGPGARAGGPEGASSSGPTIFVAVQEQLGLKMESKKAPVEILVIDHAEKAPTEN